MSTKYYQNQNSLIQISFVVLFLNTIIESLLFISDDRTIIVSAQFLLNGLLFFRFFFFTASIKKPKLTKYVIFLIIYFIFLSCFSSDLVITFNYLLKFLIPFIYLIIGYNIINKEKHLDYFLNKTWIFLAYFCIYIIIVNVFGIGSELYVGGIKTGFYSLNGLYVPCFSILIVIYNLNRLKSKFIKITSIVFTIATIIILLILLKRTLLVIILLGLILYVIKNFSFLKFIKISLFIGTITFILFYFYSDYLKLSFESRASKFNQEYDLTSEGRYNENYNIYNFMKDSPGQLLFGTAEVFNDKKFISEYYEHEREAHNSYIRIFWNGGFLGLLVFFMFYIKQFKELLLNFRLSKFYAPKATHDLFYFTLVFVLLRFLNDFSSGITYLGYNAYSYLLIGGILRIGQELKISIKKSRLKKSFIRNKIVVT